FSPLYRDEVRGRAAADSSARAARRLGRWRMSVSMHGGHGRPAGTAPAQANPAADNLRGASLMAFSMTVYTCNDATMKFVAEELPLYQSIALRSLIAGLILLAVILCGPVRLHLRALAGIGWRDSLLIGLRMICEAGATVL